MQRIPDFINNIYFYLSSDYSTRIETWSQYGFLSNPSHMASIMLAAKTDRPLGPFLSYDSTYFDFFHQQNTSLTDCYNATGERRLLMAILYRALADLSQSNYTVQESAKEYFGVVDENTYGSFYYVCNHCDLDPARILTFVNSDKCISKRGHPTSKSRIQAVPITKKEKRFEFSKKSQKGTDPLQNLEKVETL